MTKSLNRSVATRRLIVCAALLAGLVLGAVAGSIAFASSSGVPLAAAGPATTNWAKNTHGRTYGSAFSAKSLQDEPDLIEVAATNGSIGYALRSDLEGPMPTSPQEALRQQAAQAGKSETIPVYQSDGTTKIGVFVIGNW